jgi:hypothetical protein
MRFIQALRMLQVFSIDAKSMLAFWVLSDRVQNTNDWRESIKEGEENTVHNKDIMNKNNLFIVWSLILMLKIIKNNCD